MNYSRTEFGFASLDESGKEIGRLVMKDEKQGLLTIEHVVVNPAYRGQGIGKELVRQAAEHARDNNLMIIPICPYAKRVLLEDPALVDLVR